MSRPCRRSRARVEHSLHPAFAPSLVYSSCFWCGLHAAVPSVLRNRAKTGSLNLRENVVADLIAEVIRKKMECGLNSLLRIL